MSDFLYEFELAKAADVLVKQLFQLKEGEIFAITGDTLSDERAINAVARAAYAVGAKPMVVWTCTPPGPGAQVDAFLPSRAIAAAMKEADAWVEFNHMYYLYSETHNSVMAAQQKNAFFRLTCYACRYFCPPLCESRSPVAFRFSLGSYQSYPGNKTYAYYNTCWSRCRI